MEKHLSQTKSTTLFTLILFLAMQSSHAQWAETGSGAAALNANYAIRELHLTSTGLVLAAGNFKNDSNYTYVAAWNGTTWKELGGDNSLKGNNSIYAIASDTSGNIYVAGAITEGGDYVIGHWNGSGWSILGNVGFNSYIADMVTDDAGNLYVAGGFKNGSNQFYIAKWDGTAFSEVGTGGNALNPNGEFESLAVDHSGNLYATGFFTNSSGKYYVAKWNGNTWSEVGSLNANNYINDIVADAAGNVYAAGGFTNASVKYYVAKWNGSVWSEIGNLNANNFLFGLANDAAGNIYATGSFTNGNNKPYVAKWNGNSWSEVGAPNGLNPNDDIETVVADANGNVYCAGYFTNTDTLYYVAKYTATVSGIDAPKQYSFTVWPNPFTQFVMVSNTSITLEENMRVEICDVAGRKILQQQLSNERLKIDADSWQAGVYFLKITSSEKSLSQTFRLLKSN